MFKHPKIQAQPFGNSEASPRPKKNPHEFFFFFRGAPGSPQFGGGSAAGAGGVTPHGRGGLVFLKHSTVALVGGGFKYFWDIFHPESLGKMMNSHF